MAYSMVESKRYVAFIRIKEKTTNDYLECPCRHVFKNTFCGYVGGETWCDKTFKRCKSLDNTANFGGFRYMPLS